MKTYAYYKAMIAAEVFLTRSRLLCFLAALFALMVHAQDSRDKTNQEPSQMRMTNGIDLLEAKINDLALKELTLDKATDLFGRPDSVSDANTYATLNYYRKGLAFFFRCPERDKDQHLISLDIYLSKTWDTKFSEFFSPYAGSLTRSVNGDWKSKNVLERFSDFNPEDLWESNKAGREKMKALEAGLNSDNRMDSRAQSNTTFFEGIDASVFIKLKSHRLRFDYEKNTKFIEKISILFDD